MKSLGLELQDSSLNSVILEFVANVFSSGAGCDGATHGGLKDDGELAGYGVGSAHPCRWLVFGAGRHRCLLRSRSCYSRLACLRLMDSS